MASPLLTGLMMLSGSMLRLCIAAICAGLRLGSVWVGCRSGI